MIKKLPVNAGIQVRSLVLEDSTGCRVISPRVTTTEDHTPWSLGFAKEATSERNPRTTSTNREDPLLATLEKNLCATMKTQCRQK